LFSRSSQQIKKLLPTKASRRPSKSALERTTNQLKRIREFIFMKGGCFYVVNLVTPSGKKACFKKFATKLNIRHPIKSRSKDRSFYLNLFLHYWDQSFWNEAASEASMIAGNFCFEVHSRVRFCTSNCQCPRERVHVLGSNGRLTSAKSYVSMTFLARHSVFDIDALPFRCSPSRQFCWSCHQD